jgi:3'(2'), 5'-bisphosphate nucleotidase
MKQDLILLLQSGITAVKKASEVICQIQQDLTITALNKEDKSPVTVADFTAQAVISRHLSKALAQIKLVGEEDSASLHTSTNTEFLPLIHKYTKMIFPTASLSEVSEWIDLGKSNPEGNFWTLDPIDGTKGFLRQDQFAIALAYIVSGTVQIGILACPNLTKASKPEKDREGSLLYAVRGQGCWTVPLFSTGRQPERLQVSKQNHISQAIMLGSYEGSHTNPEKINAFLQKSNNENPTFRLDSQAKYAILASGHADILLRLLSPQNLDYREKIWDQAAGSIILEEAGGRITDLFGKSLDFTQGRTLAGNHGILATNGLVHEKALHILAELMP